MQKRYSSKVFSDAVFNVYLNRIKHIKKSMKCTDALACTTHYYGEMKMTSMGISKEYIIEIELNYGDSIQIYFDSENKRNKKFKEWKEKLHEL